MTVDMLAATFFWPEGTLLGSRHPDDPSGAMPTDQPAASGTDEASGFWTAMMRHLWRPSPADAAPPLPPA